MTASILPLCMTPNIGGAASVLVTNLLQYILTLNSALTPPSVWPIDFGPTAVTEGLSDYDFVVIGGGRSGSVVASRLSENPYVSVLLLEAGDNPLSDSVIPAVFLNTFSGPQVYDYKTEPTPNACLGTKTGSCDWPIAKVMGGFSSIDYLTSIRGNKAKFDEWNLPDWSWEKATEYYDFSEQYQPSRGYFVANEFEQYGEDNNISDIVVNGFKELGLENILPFAISNDHAGIGFVKGHIKDGQRMGAGESYLSVVKSRPNIQIIKNAEAKMINFSSERHVESVTFVYNYDQEMTVKVNKEAILAAGPIGNAKLLMLSGIGPQKELKRLGIPVVADLPGVGQNLRDQLGVPLAVQQSRLKARPKSAKEKNIDTMYYLTDRYGPLNTLGPSGLHGFINSDPSCEYKNCSYPDINLIHWYSQRNMSYANDLAKSIGYSDEILKSLQKANEDGNIIFTIVIIQNPKSTGHVELQSTNRLDKMKLFANYLEDDRDLESILQGIKFEMALEKTKSFKNGKAEIIQLNVPGCNHLAFKSDEYWRCYIKHMCASMFAPSGTTKMGIDTDAEAVVDLRLNVRGVHGLRACGASVFPTPVTASNTDVMVGERLAAFLNEDYSFEYVK